MTRVTVLDDYQGAASEFGDWRALPSDVDVVCFSDHVDNEDALVARLRHFEVVCVMRERTAFSGQVLRRLPELKLLVTSGYRNAVIDVAAATELGIVVCGTGGHFASTPEFTWELILAVLRQVREESAMIRAGGWQHTMADDPADGTLGVMGMGNMGPTSRGSARRSAWTSLPGVPTLPRRGAPSTASGWSMAQIHVGACSQVGHEHVEPAAFARSGGTAAVAAPAGVDLGGELALIGEEHELPYDRPFLSKQFLTAGSPDRA